MRKLAPCPAPPAHIEYLVLIRDAKKAPAANAVDHKALLVARHQDLIESYTAFATAVRTRTLSNLLPKNSLRPIKTSLLSCYNIKTAGIKRVKDEIAASQDVRILKYCPLCGLTSPSTHDHYLPSSRFPEFAVHPLNLVPCCSVCNSTKDDDWLDVDGRLQYLHLYSDLIPLDVFVKVALHTPAGTTGVGAAFSLSRPSGFRLSAWRLIESHYKKLKLLSRYTDESNSEIADILEACAEHVKAGGSSPRRFLNGIVGGQAAVYGENNWRVQLMRQLARSTKLKKLIAAATHTFP